MQPCSPAIMILCLAASLAMADRLTATGGLVVRAMDEQGRLVQIAGVQLWVTTATGVTAFDFPAHLTDSLGISRVPRIPPGRYEGANINGPDYTPGSLLDVQIKVGLRRVLACTRLGTRSAGGQAGSDTGSPSARSRLRYLCPFPDTRIPGTDIPAWPGLADVP